MNFPIGETNFGVFQGFAPSENVFIDAIDERAIEIKQDRRQGLRRGRLGNDTDAAVGRWRFAERVGNWMIHFFLAVTAANSQPLTSCRDGDAAVLRPYAASCPWFRDAPKVSIGVYWYFGVRNFGWCCIGYFFAAVGAGFTASASFCSSETEEESRWYSAGSFSRLAM